MNVVELLQSHSSVRNFKDEHLSEAIKCQLLEAAQSGSTSNFVQATTILEISDENLKNKLAEISNSAPYVKKTGVFYVFVADLYRQSVMLQQAHKSLAGIQNMESLLVSVVDTTICAENMVVAAESMGLGICYIGGIRNQIDKVADLLHLPKYTVPLFGMTIGIPVSKNECKPRMPLNNFTAQNYYDIQSSTDMSSYDKVIHDYYASRSTNAREITWTKHNVDFFSEVRRPQVADFLKKQGFKL